MEAILSPIIELYQSANTDRSFADWYFNEPIKTIYFYDDDYEYLERNYEEDEFSVYEEEEEEEEDDEEYIKRYVREYCLT